eukprot:gene18331-18594_t
MSDQSDEKRCPAVASIAIIGGGFTGAAVAFHLAQKGHTRIFIFEPRETLGGGLAYSAGEPVYRINVPATKMSLLPEDKLHFARWLAEKKLIRSDPKALAKDGRLYPRRAQFGAYIAEHLEPALVSGTVQHIRHAVSRVERRAVGWSIEAGDTTLAADILILAASHPAPSIPPALRALGGYSNFHKDLFNKDIFKTLQPEERILVVGSGLTAADAVAALNNRNHRGPIILISRRGQKPQPQAYQDADPVGDFTQPPIHTARALIRTIRTTLKKSKAKGIIWQYVLDAVRLQGPVIWQHLPLAERRRLVRHARPFWDAHRFRMAPQVQEALADGEASGHVRFLKASIVQVSAKDKVFRVTFWQSRTRSKIVQTFDRIILTTGPSHKDILAQDWLKSLHEQGFVDLDPTLLGLATSRNGESINKHGEAVADLFIAGPLARGTFGELMGLPEVSNYALFVAERVNRLMSAL